MRPRLAAIRKPAWRALAGMAAIAALAMAALWWQARQAPPPAVVPANRGIAVALVDVGDPAVVIAVASAHRAEAFAACRDLIESIKAELPVWKRQVEADGTTAWKGLGG